MSHLINIVKDRNEETLPNTYSTIPDCPSHIDKNKESWRLGDFNQPSVPDWSYPINTCPSPNTMNKTGIIITTLHRANVDTTLPSHIVNHLTNTQLHILLLSNH